MTMDRVRTVDVFGLPTLEDEPLVGQVWHWHVLVEDHVSYVLDELYLLLAKPLQNTGAFDALNLTFGKIEMVFPYLSAGSWWLVDREWR